MYYRHRWYDTYTGRFTTHDPLSYGDGMNLYNAFTLDPLFNVDPWGLLPVERRPDMRRRGILPPLPPTPPSPDPGAIRGKRAIQGMLDTILSLTVFGGGKQCYNSVYPSPIAGTQIGVRACTRLDVMSCCQDRRRRGCLVFDITVDGGLHAAGSIRPGWSPPPRNWKHPINFRQLKRGKLPGWAFRVPLRHGVGVGCPPEGVRGQICITGSIGVWSWSVGIRGCVSVPDWEPRVQFGMGIGEGSGVSVGGGITITECWDHCG